MDYREAGRRRVARFVITGAGDPNEDACFVSPAGRRAWAEAIAEEDVARMPNKPRMTAAQEKAFTAGYTAGVVAWAKRIRAQKWCRRSRS